MRKVWLKRKQAVRHQISKQVNLLITGCLEGLATKTLSSSHLLDLNVNE